MIGLLGGSFDPIHHGHLLVAQAAVEALGLASLRFVPAREQPFKRGRHGADAAHRARMVELAIAGEPRFGMERVERRFSDLKLGYLNPLNIIQARNSSSGGSTHLPA